MALEISEAERERRALVGKLRGRLFPAEILPHSVKYSHGDKPRLPLGNLPETGSLPLRIDRPYAVIESRTVRQPG
jgi:hypothetical protein